MANKKISELPELTNPTGGDVFPIVNDGDTKKIQVNNLKGVLGINQINDDISTINLDIGNIENGLEVADTNAINALTRVNNLWIPTSGTLTYSSADSPVFVINTSLDLTGIISVGMRLKLTQTTTKYFIVVAITSTTITLYGGTDYTLANASITDVFFSSAKAPHGFPSNPDKWTVILRDTQNIQQNTPTNETWYNMVNLSVPIGSWKIQYNCAIRMAKSAGAMNMFVTLSSANNSETDTDYTSVSWTNGITLFYQTLFKEKVTNFSNKTTVYLNVKSTTAGSGLADAIGIRGDYSVTVLKATCAYL